MSAECYRCIGLNVPPYDPGLPGPCGWVGVLDLGAEMGHQCPNCSGYVTFVSMSECE